MIDAALEIRLLVITGSTPAFYIKQRRQVYGENRSK